MYRYLSFRLFIVVFYIKTVILKDFIRAGHKIVSDFSWCEITILANCLECGTNVEGFIFPKSSWIEVSGRGRGGGGGGGGGGWRGRGEVGGGEGGGHHAGSGG
jgi:hypothetical protein